MKMQRIEILSLSYLYILLMSFMPLLIKGILHVQGGSYVPMILINLIGVPLIYGLYYGKSWVTFFIKSWAIWLMVYGVLRVGLQVMVGFMDAGVEANITSQLTFGYLAMSLLHFTVGFGLNRFLYSCIWVAQKPAPVMA